ncbi:hypothetical protein KP509_13G059500 [Ceratopteris richardii]|uniref:Exostosin GT47 domain-containing protein n=1 Tax=Ceratopteris richardii TaxID=49495 RepID=A0A8T2TJ60_CERRI|nr:hypothetical protein KP509_13G059500 [Ceratopteris richardii]
MGNRLVKTLSCVAALFSLIAITCYIALFNGPFQYAYVFSSSTFQDLRSRTNSQTQLQGVQQANRDDGYSCNCTTQTSQTVVQDGDQSNQDCANATQQLLQKAASPDKRKQPWYAEGRTWHYPVLFPRCSMDACFNFSRCTGDPEHGSKLLIYSYDTPSPPVKYFTGVKSSQWNTENASIACLFFVFLDLNSPHRPHPRTLPHWNDGMNHVLISFADMWKQRGPPPETIGFASVMASDMHETIYRAGFDISIPLPGKVHMRELQGLPPGDGRRYLLTFRGLRYLGRPSDEGVLRSAAEFRALHNGVDVVVVTSCRHATNDAARRDAPELGVHCEEDQALYAKYTFRELMNTTFGLVPAGRQPSCYRMIEVMSAGAIPVLVADNYVKPFDTLIHWHRCLIQFPSSHMHLILPTLRSIPSSELLDRQRYCIRIYNSFLKDDATLLRSAINALTARFLGAVPLALPMISTIDK